MDNDSQNLDALTSQTVTISLGGRSYQARRANLYDIGVMNKEKKRILNSEDSENADMEVTFFLLFHLIKDYNPQGIFSPEDLMKSIPFENYQDVTNALAAVGFKKPQAQSDQAVNEVTGA